MRRILALAAVTGLALTGLTSTPAAADNTIQADPGDVVINEVAVDLSDTLVSDINYVELRNTTGSPINVDGWAITACDANGEINTTILYGPIDDFKLAGDTNYANSGFGMSVPRDYALAGTNGDGLDPDGGLVLIDDTPITPQVIHNVIFTDPDTAPQALLTCVAESSLTPEEFLSSFTTSDSAERRVDAGTGAVSWHLDDPTPGAPNQP